MAKALKIALIQLECKIGDISYNLKHSLKLAKEAAENGADLICLPEMFTTGYNLDTFGDRINQLAEDENGITLGALKKFASEHNVYLMASIAFYHLNHDEKPNISAFLIDNRGGLAGIYDKNHLFGREKEYFCYGEAYPVFDTEYGKIGIMLCYDANFPEPARILTLLGAQIILCPAAWRVQDIRLFDMIMPQRAAENIAYVCAVNRYGNDDGRLNPGHSQVCAPDGTVIALSEKAGEDILYADIHTDEVDTLRKEIPYLQDLRYDEYIKYLK